MKNVCFILWKKTIRTFWPTQYFTCLLRLLYPAPLERSGLAPVFMESWGTGRLMQTFSVGYSFVSKLRQGKNNHQKEKWKAEREKLPYQSLHKGKRCHCSCYVHIKSFEVQGRIMRPNTSNFWNWLGIHLSPFMDQNQRQISVRLSCTFLGTKHCCFSFFWPSFCWAVTWYTNRNDPDNVSVLKESI